MAEVLCGCVEKTKAGGYYRPGCLCRRGNRLELAGERASLLNFRVATVLALSVCHSVDLFPLNHRARLVFSDRKESMSMAWFYEIRSSNNAVLKRDGGFATQDAAKIAGREDAKKMKNMRQPDRPDVGSIIVGQNAEKAMRY
jgi:hypothetical protein